MAIHERVSVENLNPVCVDVTRMEKGSRSRNQKLILRVFWKGLVPKRKTEKTKCENKNEEK